MIGRSAHLPLREVAPEVARDLDNLITRCLSIEPGQRPQSARAVVTLLKASQLRLQSRSKGKRNSSLIAAGMIIAACATWIGYRHIEAVGGSDRTLRAIPLTGNSAPRISPDGALVAYAAKTGFRGVHHIFVKAVTGGETSALTTGRDDDNDPV